MKIEQVEIWNLRAFEHAEIKFDDYTCFVGANGAGKSTVLTALNIFFRQSEHTGTNLQFLDKEDFHKSDTSKPVKIRVTFKNLTEEALEEFKHYARNERLVITAEAVFDPSTNRAEVKHFGERSVFPDFIPFFKALSEGAKAAEYNEIYSGLQERFELPAARSKEAKIAELRSYESARPDECQLERSSDQFYGVSKGANRLEKFVQWVFVPAVKDAVDEQVEAKNGALGKLLARAVRAKSSFGEEMEELRELARQKYQAVLTKNQVALDEISGALNDRLVDWSHQGAKLKLEWKEDQDKSIRIEEPFAHVQVSEGAFEGQLARLGHGLQRSYLIALLQELALYDRDDAPTLILAIEEPELYQHPPQARHLADVLGNLADDSAQVVVCSHSPYFVSGYLFEQVRMVRRDNETQISCVTHGTADSISARLAECVGGAVAAPTGTLARLQQILQPQISEMFFANSIIFVEGREDVAYLKSYLELNRMWDYLRRLGCHIIPVDKKSELLRPIIVASEVGIPTLVMFDADSDAHERHLDLHRADNRKLFRALNIQCDEGFPGSDIFSENAIVWASNLTTAVKESIDELVWAECRQVVDQEFGHTGGMQKNVMHIARMVEELAQRGVKPDPLSKACDTISRFAGLNSGGVDESTAPARPPTLP